LIYQFITLLLQSFIPLGWGWTINLAQGPVWEGRI